MFRRDTGLNVRAGRISGILGTSRSRSIAEGPAVIPVGGRTRRNKMKKMKEKRR